jgi:hypothetical protein
LKAVTCIGAAICFTVMFFIGFDPWHGIDAMIWRDLYGTSDLPDLAKPAFTLAFLVFTWLSVLTMILVYLITKYALAKKEKWAYSAILLIGIFWPLGAAVITVYTKAWSYFISVGMMTIMFFPPVVLLYPYFRNKRD